MPVFRVAIERALDTIASDEHWRGNRVAQFQSDGIYGHASRQGVPSVDVLRTALLGAAIVDKSSGLALIKRSLDL